MKPSRLFRVLPLCVLWSASIAQQTKEPLDITPLSIQEKFLKWEKPQKEGKGTLAGLLKTKSQADTWFNRYSQPSKGVIILRSGDRHVGNIIIHNRYNEASQHKIKDDQGNSKVNPEGVNVIEDIQMVQDGSTTVYKGDSVLAYWISFRIADWSPDKKSTEAADKFIPGSILDPDDSLLTGFVALATNRPTYKDLKYFQTVFFAANQSQDVEIYSSYETAVVGLPRVLEASQTVNGTIIKYARYRGALVDQAAWIARIESDSKKMDADPLVPGQLILKNDGVLKGRFALSNSKKKTWAYFIDENRDLFYISSAVGFKVLQLTVAGQTQQYVALEGRMVRNSETITALEKDGTLHPGRVGLNDGRIIEGRVSLKRMKNVIKSYRLTYGTYVVPAGANTLVEEYGARDIDFVEDVVDGNPVKLVPLDGVLIPIDDYIKSLESGNKKDNTKNLQNGFIAFSDGRKLEGRLHMESSTVVLVTKDNKLQRYRAQTEGLSHLVMTIDGVERKFIPQLHGIKAFAPAGYNFVEVMEPGGLYSYCVNTYPTHLKKGITRLAKSAINTTTDAGRQALANEAAKEQVRSEMKDSGDVAAAVAAGAEAQSEVIDATAGVVEVSDEGGIYHKEWIIMNNKTGENVAVYKGNYEEEIKALLAQCTNYSTLDKKEIRRLSDLDLLGEAVKFLNSCGR